MIPEGLRRLHKGRKKGEETSVFSTGQHSHAPNDHDKAEGEKNTRRGG